MALKFLHPEAFYFTAFLAFPIIIHLFNFKKFKRIYFTNVRFLKEVTLQTQNHSRLKHFLVLLCRLLFFFFIILAFAQPYIPVQKNSRPFNLADIYIDNSLSMENEGRNGILLEDAKNKALEILSFYGDSRRYHILTNDFESSTPGGLTKDEAREYISHIHSSPSSRKLSSVIQKQSANNREAKKNYVISDFQKSFADFQILNKDTGLNTTFIYLSSAGNNNIALDSAYLADPVILREHPNEYILRVRNYGNKKITGQSVKMYLDGQQKSFSTIDLEPGTSTLVKMGFTISKGGWHTGYFETEDFPVSFDNKLFFSFYCGEQIKVMLIGKENPYLKALLNDDKNISLYYTDENHIPYSKLQEFSLIILNELTGNNSGLNSELKKASESGSSLVLIPSASNGSTVSNILESFGLPPLGSAVHQPTRLSQIDLENDLLDGVFEKVPKNMDFPKSEFRYNISEGRYPEKLIRADNGDVFLCRYHFKKSDIYLFASPLNKETGNFVENALFVPVIYNMALYSEPGIISQGIIHTENGIPLRLKNVKSDEALHLIKEKTDIIPEVNNSAKGLQLFDHQQAGEPGIYKLMKKDSLIQQIAYNYSVEESDPGQLSVDEIKAQCQRFTGVIPHIIQAESGKIHAALKEDQEGKTFWKWCLISALLFLLAEILLLKRHNEQTISIPST